MIDYEKFEKSLKHLELQNNNHKNLANRKDLGDLEREAIAESVIHRFETCYDSLWKVLKRYLVEELGLVDMPNSPKPVFQFAFENKLLSDVVKWKEYADARVNTSHDYSNKKALETLIRMDDFIADAILLYETMTKKKWA